MARLVKVGDAFVNPDHVELVRVAHGHSRPGRPVAEVVMTSGRSVIETTTPTVIANRINESLEES